jgi:hypothetical protein
VDFEDVWGVVLVEEGGYWDPVGEVHVGAAEDGGAV